MPVAKHFDASTGETIEFETFDEREAYFNAKYPEGDIHSVVEARMEKGRVIMLEYLTDNARLNLDFEQSIQQLQKFQVVKAMLEVGNLEDSKTMIEGTETDAVFTQERKEKYLAMFDN